MSYNGTWVPNSSGSPVYGTGASGFTGDLSLSQLGYVSLPTGAFPSTNTFSVSARIKTTSAGANPGVLFGVGNVSQAGLFWIGIQGSTIRVSYVVSGGVTNHITGAVNVLDGAWHTILVTVNAGTVNLYVDGSADGGTGAGAYLAATPTSVAIGNLPLLGTFEFQGEVDEVAVFTSVISTTAQSSPWSNSAANINALYHLDSSLNDSAVPPASIVSSPTTMIAGTSNVSLTITGTNTAFSGTPFTLNGVGGSGSAPAGASIVSQTINSGTSATVVINAPSSVATFSIVDSNSSAFAALTATSNLTTPGTPTLSATGGTGTGLTVTSTGSTGGTAPITYQWYRGLTNNPTTLLTNQTGLTMTDRGLLPGTAYYYKVVATDAASTVTTSAVAGPFTTHAALSTTLKLGVIGDSISVIFETGTETSMQFAADVIEQLYGVDARTVVVTNRAISGKTSTNWNPGGSGDGSFAAALTALQAANCTYCHIMIGTNDSKNSVATTQATYKANLQAMITSLTTAGIKTILSFSPYVDYATAGSPWDSNSNPLLKQYQVAILQLIDNVNVFLGNDACWQFFSTHTSELGSSSLSGIHPNETGLIDLGNLHGQGIYRAVYATPVTSGGTTVRPFGRGPLGN